MYIAETVTWQKKPEGRARAFCAEWRVACSMLSTGYRKYFVTCLTWTRFLFGHCDKKRRKRERIIHQNLPHARTRLLRIQGSPAHVIRTTNKIQETGSELREQPIRVEKLGCWISAKSHNFKFFILARSPVNFRFSARILVIGHFDLLNFDLRP